LNKKIILIISAVLLLALAAAAYWAMFYTFSGRNLTGTPAPKNTLEAHLEHRRSLGLPTNVRERHEYERKQKELERQKTFEEKQGDLNVE